MKFRTGLALIGLVAFMQAGCGRRENAVSDQELERTYGDGPDRKGSVVYQHDVVIIGGGPRAIRSASANGLVWTIDGEASGAKKLAVGKVMFATSRAAGRVMKIEPRGDDLAVTLAPVKLTELIRDGRIAAHVNLAPGSLTYQYVPELPGIESSAQSDLGERIGRPAYVLAMTRQPDIVHSLIPVLQSAQTAVMPQPKMPLASKNSIKVSVGDWEVEPSINLKQGGDTTSGTIRLKVQKKLLDEKEGGTASIGLKFGADVSLLVENLQVDMATSITDGNIASADSRFVIKGINGLDISLWGGASEGLQDNQKVRFEVPVEMNFPVPLAATGGIPFIGQIKIKFIIETIFQAKNDTLQAHGLYGLYGPMGFVGSSPVLPVFSVVTPMIDQIQATSLKGAGIVFAWEARFLAGVGTPAAMGGFYGKITPAVGAAFGSVLGIGMGPTCRGVTLKVTVAGGIGVQVSAEVAPLLEKLLGTKAKTDFDIGEISATAVDKKAVWPDTDKCLAH